MQRQYVPPVVAKPSIHVPASGTLVAFAAIDEYSPTPDVVIDDAALTSHVSGCTCPGCLAYRRSLKQSIHPTTDSSSTDHSAAPVPDSLAAPAKAASTTLPPTLVTTPAPEAHSVLADAKVVAALASLASAPGAAAAAAHAFSGGESALPGLSFGHLPIHLGGMSERLHL